MVQPSVSIKGRALAWSRRRIVVVAATAGKYLELRKTPSAFLSTSVIGFWQMSLSSEKRVVFVTDSSKKKLNKICVGYSTTRTCLPSTVVERSRESTIPGG